LVAYRPDSVFVSLAVRMRPGEQDCQGRDPDPYTLELSEPLGSRSVFDASLVPPVLVEAPASP
jgi:hypothetical protein